jgi:hypothetical protein
VGTFVSFLTLGEMVFSLSTLSTMLAIGLSCIAFIMLRYLPSIPSFFRVLSGKEVEFFQRYIEMIKWFMSLLLLMCCITFNGFAHIETSLYPWDEDYLVMVSDLSNILLNSICHYFIEDFCIYAH